VFTRGSEDGKAGAERVDYGGVRNGDVAEVRTQ
jgi:hypothetical protein